MSIALIREMEYMVDELHYYKKAGIFTEKAIQSIIKKRRVFEDMLSSQPTLNVYLLALQYEIQLERIYNRRVKQISKRKKYIMNRIDNLFRRAEFTFPADIEIMITHLGYYVSTNNAKKVIYLAAELPKKHAGHAAAWIFSAQSLRKVGEVEGSRVLLQRALRILKNKQEILDAFIGLETEYPENDSSSIIAVLQSHELETEKDQETQRA
ncbi:hypothetical protein NEOKW01_1454 [Nematocida sp. AWRm80]|nr:hypothetical protein NEOKW01_1454 [Nematocida sp. AWRm80]